MGLTNLILKILEKERSKYALPFENNVEGFRKVIKTGDVVLVSGQSYISGIIKIVTKSNWSHCFLYMGDGKIIEADSIIYESAEPRKVKNPRVMENPVEKYFPYNIRIKRPEQITEEHLKQVLAEARNYVGKDYDKKNIANFIWKGLGMKKFDFKKSMGSEDKYICSALIAKLFQNVGYPILPDVAIVEDGKRSIKKINYTHIAPGDFDLASSQYWRTIPFQGIGRTKHYTELIWDE